MLFFISAPGYTSSQFNATKIRVHLRSGVAEILPGHQAMLGKVDQNIIEVETNFENKLLEEKENLENLLMSKFKVLDDKTNKFYQIFIPEHFIIS